MFSIIHMYYATAYISFYIALQFIFFSPYVQTKKLYVYFIIMTICVGLYQYYTAVYYEESSLTMAVKALKIQFSAIILFFIALYLFLSEYFEVHVNKIFLTFLSLLSLIGLFENIISPYGIRFESITSSSVFILPWGEELKYYHGFTSSLFHIFRFISLAILLWAMWRVKIHFDKNRYESILLSIFLVALIGSIILGYLIDEHHLKFIYLGGFAYCFLVIAMTISLGLRIFHQGKQLEQTSKELLEENNLRKIAEQHLLYNAEHDELTGLANRKIIVKRLDESIKQANRSSVKVALLLIDIDRFKDINESFGHIAGDKVLTQISQRMAESIRETDCLARLGGDEFCILIPAIVTIDEATHVAMKVINSIQKKLFIDGHELYISGSIGISIYPNDGNTSVELLRNADSAMYKAKLDRNNYQFYTDDMTQKALERITLESELRQALVNEEFVVYYQPQVNGSNEALIGMEALVRWNHPKRGLVSPMIFIPIAEESGLIVPLERWVMNTAMKQIEKWYSKGLNPGVLAINLSIRQLQEKGFMSAFKNILHETKFKSEWLELEVTEGQIMKNPNESIALLKQISQIGIRIAIDDFGTGYSSLSYLKRLPIDKLKIDKSFVDGLPNDDEDISIANAVIALANSLNHRVIAEGVETVEQKDFLIQNGCENIQGYFYGKPMPAEEFEQMFLH